MVTSNKTKILLIIGLLLILVGAVIAGVVLVRQRAILKQKAATTATCTGTVTCTDNINNFVSTVDCSAIPNPDPTTCSLQAVSLPNSTCIGSCVFNVSISCNQDSDCQPGLVCSSGTCVTPSSTSCGAGYLCVTGTSSCANQLKPEGVSCSENGAPGLCCPPVTGCSGNFCIDQGQKTQCESPMVVITNSVICGTNTSNYECVCGIPPNPAPGQTPTPGGGGGCFATCSTDADCVGGYTCVHNSSGGQCYTSNCIPPNPGSNQQGAYVYCQDGNGTIYPMPGVGIGVSDNGINSFADPTFTYPTQVTDATGLTMFSNLNTGRNYLASITSGPGYTADIPFVAQLNATTWQPIQNPLANNVFGINYYNSLKLPTGQPYTSLTFGDTGSVFTSCHFYQWYWQNWGPGWPGPAGSSTSSAGAGAYFCAVPSGIYSSSTVPSQAGKYYFDIPSYGEGKYGMVFRFSNCGSLPTPAPSPTPVPPVSSCSNARMYDTSWNLLSAAQVSALQPGAQVYFTVMGTTTGSFDMARFIINGVTTPTTTSQKPGSPGEFDYLYTIPVGVTSFAVTGQLHDSVSGQWF